MDKKTKKELGEKGLAYIDFEDFFGDDEFKAVGVEDEIDEDFEHEYVWFVTNSCYMDTMDTRSIAGYFWNAAMKNKENKAARKEELKEKNISRVSKTVLLKSLGWEDKGFNGFGRWEFRMGDYWLFEHQGEIGIITEGDAFKYCNLSEEEIKEYTRLVKRVIEIDNDEENYTLYEYRLAKEELKNYTEKLIERS